MGRSHVRIGMNEQYAGACGDLIRPTTEIMGIVKRSLELENFLDSHECEWLLATDRKYKEVFSEVHEFLDAGEFSTQTGDSAFNRLVISLPFNGFIISLPKTKYFNIYANGGPRNTFAYVVKNLKTIGRERLNSIECVLISHDVSFACGFSHEWDAHCPETHYERNT